MAKYRKKFCPEAVQFNKLGDHPAVFATEESPTGFAIFTLEHTKVAFEVKLTDWILTGPLGEVYAHDHESFIQAYEKVGEDMSDTPKVFDLGDDLLLVIGRLPNPEQLAALKDMSNEELAIVIDVKELVGFLPPKE